ncbi:MAG: PHB depolymerase family esterase [Planctomycetaceae bacterium]|jgi:pimeloyl-ACP methyl ester carboxylesterase|nr:PHB depolymerase family esterase [Planctomycetaceae bacterium]
MKRFLFCFIVFELFFILPVYGKPVKIAMDDGRFIVGEVTEIERVDEKLETAGVIKAKMIVVLNDGLRFIYVPKYKLRRGVMPEVVNEMPEVFKTKLPFSETGKKLAILGSFDPRVKFDRFGRRLVRARHLGGVELITQVITEISPRYIRARGLHMNSSPIVWDMRLSTRTLPREQLNPILMRLIDPERIDDRVRLVRFYIQSGMLDEAEDELEEILKSESDNVEIQQRFSSVYRMIRQQKFQRLIDDMESRWNAGQFSLVHRFLDDMAKGIDLPEELFSVVRRMLLRYDELEKKRKEIIEQLHAIYNRLPVEEKRSDLIPKIIEEIETGLTPNTIDRMESFYMYANDPELSDSEKLAIGITGWFCGSNADNNRLLVAQSLPTIRRLVTEYLQSGGETIRQAEIIKQIKSMESISPALVASMIAYMPPPKPILPEEIITDKLGYFRLKIPSPIGGVVHDIEYAVQLPPEYDPNRTVHYPVIVTLNGFSQTPDSQINFWAGEWRGDNRVGQSGRHGYIVIAPNWNPLQLFDYDFSAFAHAAVLCSLKDAIKRFNIDTDRVYLSGHGTGGTAAWDVGLAHPDLWAGLVPFNAVASKYINEYKDNVQHLPVYFVCGELEGKNGVNTLLYNAPIFNNYLVRQKEPHEITLIRYIGHGMEMFHDEIVPVFDWMKLHVRNFAPRSFVVNSMRSWDNFFWWVELGNLSNTAPEYITDPIEWGSTNKKLTIKSRLLPAGNGIQVDNVPKNVDVTIYLNPDILPEMANYKPTSKVTVNVGNKNYNPRSQQILPDIAVILYDVKTRGDRLHPFWAMLRSKKK